MPFQIFPPEMRQVVPGRSRWCEGCVRFGRRGGSCPGVADRSPSNPPCFNLNECEAAKPYRKR